MAGIRVNEVSMYANTSLTPNRFGGTLPSESIRPTIEGSDDTI